jgi:hypothetical protein
VGRYKQTEVPAVFHMHPFRKIWAQNAVAQTTRASPLSTLGLGNSG